MSGGGDLSFECFDTIVVIPRSETAETNPPYVCPGCFVHTYSNNTINRCHIQ
jgi:hypothetical protein